MVRISFLYVVACHCLGENPGVVLLDGMSDGAGRGLDAVLAELVEHGLDGGLARSLVTDLVEVDEVLEPRFLEVTILQILGNLLGWVLPGLPLTLPLLTPLLPPLIPLPHLRRGTKFSLVTLGGSQE